MARPSGAEQAPSTGALLTTEQAFAYLKEKGAWAWSLSKFYDFVAVDAIPHVRVNARFYMHAAELDDWVRNGRVNRYPALAERPPATVTVTAEAIADGIRQLAQGLAPQRRAS